MNQSELEANNRNLRQARGKNALKQIMIGFSFISDWLKNGAKITNQSQSVVMQNQRKRNKNRIKIFIL